MSAEDKELDEREREALESWPAMTPRPDFADRVLAARRAQIGRRRVIAAGGAVVAAAVVLAIGVLTIGTTTSEPPPRATSDIPLVPEPSRPVVVSEVPKEVAHPKNDKRPQPDDKKFAVPKMPEMAETPPLASPAPPGSFMVYPQPAAPVFLDGKRVGNGDAPLQVNVTNAAGVITIGDEQTPFRITLRYSLDKDTVTLDSQPWARVKRDGVDIGSTPRLLTVSRNTERFELANPAAPSAMTVVVKFRGEEPLAAKDEPAVSEGSFMVYPTPAAPIFRDGVRLSSGAGPTRVDVTKTKGTITVGDASSPFVVTMSYKLGTRGAELNIDSQPWAILKRDGVSVGRTPRPGINAYAQTQRFELVSPQVQGGMVVVVKFSGGR